MDAEQQPGESQTPTEKKKLFSVESFVKIFPAVAKPAYKQSLNARLKWTGIALLSFLIMSYIPVFGVPTPSSNPELYEQFRFFEIVLGSRFGSLMSLGIGP